MKKKFILFVIMTSLLMNCFNICMSAVTDIEVPVSYKGGIGDSKSANQTAALTWVQTQANAKAALDYDGSYGAQCVDLIYYYYKNLGVMPVGGDAIDYTSNILPSGWQRIKCTSGFIPQPGDIAVWYANHSCSTCNTGEYGHVGIVTSASDSKFVAVNQNYNDKMYCTSVTFNTSALHSVIRPDFSNWGGTITASWYEWYDGCFVDETNAEIAQYVKFNGFSATKGSRAGCYLYSTDGTQLAQCSFTLSKDYNPMSINCNITDEMGYTLSPGTTYKYKFFVNTNGTTYYSPMKEFTTKGATEYSYNQATVVEWIKKQAEVKAVFDYDNSYGAQCVDLIYYYYKYLGVSPVGGDAIDYASNTLPSGWKRIKCTSGFIPQPGDIAVWYANHSCSTCNTGEYGHVGIVTSASDSKFVAVNQNYNDKMYCTSVTFNTSALHSVIRPDFSNWDATVTVSWSKNTSQYLIGETNAVLAHKGALTGINNHSVSNVGCYLYDMNDELLDQISESTSGKMDGASSVWIKYDINDELKYALTPGTTYKYKFYAVINGTAYYSPMYEFTTTLSSNPSGNCGANDNNLTWKLYDDGELVISGTGDMANWDSDSSAPWFVYCDKITDVTIGADVTSIGEYAFYKCENLQSIDIPDSVTSIGKSAFSRCYALTNVNIPDGVTVIDSATFAFCENLANIDIPDSVTSIGLLAFENCKSFTSVVIPEEVTTIGMMAFSGCSNLQSVTVYSRDVTFSGDFVFSSASDDFTICGYTGSTAEAYANENGHTFVGIRGIVVSGEFGEEGDNLTWVLYSDGELVISGEGAFEDWDRYYEEMSYGTAWYSYSSQIKTVTIERGVTSISRGSFYECTNLTSVNIPDSVTRIDRNAFADCPKLERVTVYSQDVSFGLDVFVGASEDFIIQGYASSTAETYANQKGHTFVAFSVSVTGIALNKTSTTLNVEATETLTATVAPSNATNKTVSWTSSNTSVATVSNGVVTARAAGTTIITATTVDGSKMATCVVTVEEPIVDSDVIYTIGSASGKPGGTVEVALSVSSDVAVNGLLLDNLSYDENALEFVEFAEYGDLITTSALGANGVDSAKGEIALGYTDAVIPNGQICIIKLRVKDTAEDGEYTISIDGAASANGQKLSSEVNSGKITISKWVSGDFDSNEKLDMKDVVYFMNWINFSWTGKYPMVYDGDKDFNKDGNVDMKDVVYFMNWVNFSWTGNYDINW